MNAPTALWFVRVIAMTSGWIGTCGVNAIVI